jgi:O-6-methylguanine DNA methyltransferase
VDFDFSFDLSGLPSFTRRVLCVVAGIPYGATRSYGWVARRAGSPRAARAVGQIMARNRLAPIVPCHRVVGGRGSLIGWGAGIDYRRRLLVMESVIAAQPRTGRARTTRRRS